MTDFAAARGNRLTNTDMSGTDAYSYDVYQQLAKALHPDQPEEDYAYDGVGNRLNGSGLNYTYSADNRMLTKDINKYSYDANGNTISKTDASGVTSYQFDFENRLIKAVMPNNTIAQYEYDALGRRIEKNVNGVIKKYLYDGYNILAEYDNNGNQVARYTQNLAIDDPLAMARGGSVHYYHKDALGSITAMTDVNGQVAQTYEYDSFGNIANQTGNIENPFTYTGREYDAETGLYFYRARYYDSKAGRFINEDPIGFEGGINLFRYVYSSPITYIDSDGLMAHYANGPSDGQNTLNPTPPPGPNTGQIITGGLQAGTGLADLGGAIGITIGAFTCGPLVGIIVFIFYGIPSGAVGGYECYHGCKNIHEGYHK